MEYKLAELIDIPLLQDLQEKLNVIYSFPSSIIDNEGKILTAVGWQDICTKFHRVHPECEKECIKSDLFILEHLKEANPAVSYQCPHGLVDNASPIVIDGKHLGNFFTGQFFFEKPDLDFFRGQAKKYNFDEKSYLEAVERVPIWSKERLAQYLDFVKGFIEIIAGSGLKRLREIESSKALKESEERYRAIVQSTSDWIWEIDEAGKYNYCSDSVLNILGYSVEEIIGKSPFDLMSPVEAGRVGAIFQGIVERKERIVDLENWNLHKDGHKVCLLTNGSPILNEVGDIIGFRGADKDISERKKANEELERAKDKAEESDRLKSAFLANMSHEIRTPMNGILGFTELLKEPNLSRDEQKEYIRIIEKSGMRMLNLINDIIDFSKIEAGLMKVNLKKSNINEQIEYLYQFFLPEAESKGIVLSFNNALTAKESTLITDSEKLLAILTNLVKNAIKYTKRGAIHFGYTMETIDGIAYLQFFVKDTGCGIPESRLEAIFERFIQADLEDKMALQGAGLGLSISKGYVELLGGSIWVESKENIGSTFYFTLPYLINSMENSSENQCTLYELSEDPVDHKNLNLKILIAEDDETSMLLIGKLILPYSRELLYARNGMEAVQICRDNPDINMVLMDIQMPYMGGYEAARKIREFDKKVVIIAQTAYALAGDRAKSIRAGCNDHVSKPIDSRLLNSLIYTYFVKG
jgi:hypothetical protein